jgi:hypothetical protein
MPRIAIVFLGLLVTVAIACQQHSQAGAKPAKAATATRSINIATLTQLQKKAAGLKKFAVTIDGGTRYCFLIDMSLPSGSNRFFVYDMQRDTVAAAGLVTHGYGNSTATDISFSNTPGSNSSSLGRYRIGVAYQGKFGLAYKLHGLDPSNSNAYQRYVVLHAHDCVPDVAVSPQTICMSQGCPTVSPAFLQVLKKYINSCNKPLLLWVF